MILRKHFITWLFVLGAPFASNALAGEEDGRAARTSSLSARMVLKVVHPAKVRKEVVSMVGSRGGFAALVTDQRLSLRVPPGEFAGLIREIGKLGQVIEKTMERKDITERIAQLEGRLRSKQEILKKLRSFFDDSNVQATLQIEKNMTQLVVELEKVKGQLRVTLDQARFARIDLEFSFRKRDRIVYVSSPFEWLNTVDLDRFLAEF